MKRYISLFMVLCLLFSLSATALEEPPRALNSVDFDLSQGNQEFHTFDEEGNPVTISVEKVPTRGRGYPLGDGYGTWHIKYDTLFSEIGYYTDIYVDGAGKTTINDVYDLHYGISVMDVVSSELRTVRAQETASQSARCELYMEAKIVIVGSSTNGYLRGDFKNKVLTVTWY